MWTMSGSPSLSESDRKGAQTNPRKPRTTGAPTPRTIPVPAPEQSVDAADHPELAASFGA